MEVNRLDVGVSRSYMGVANDFYDAGDPFRKNDESIRSFLQTMVGTNNSDTNTSDATKNNDLLQNKAEYNFFGFKVDEHTTSVAIDPPPEEPLVATTWVEDVQNFFGIGAIGNPNGQRDVNSKPTL